MGHPEAGQGGRANEVVRLVRDWLGPQGLAQSVVRRELPPFEHANLQVALDAWSAREGRAVQVHGRGCTGAGRGGGGHGG